MIDKTINKWWEKLQNQCPNCKKYLCFKLFKEDEKYYYKKCSFCGFENKHEIAFAEYKIENGKTFLRNNIWNEFKEVELVERIKKRKRYFQVRSIKVIVNPIKIIENKRETQRLL